MTATTSFSAPKEASRWLSRAGLRPTRQRTALASLLVEGGNRHLTAEALYAEAQEAGATRVDDHPHFYFEDDGSIADAPIGSVKISELPDVPDGCEIASVDVVVRLRRR